LQGDCFHKSYLGLLVDVACRLGEARQRCGLDRAGAAGKREGRQ
jgi:hypothetical protein